MTIDDPGARRPLQLTEEWLYKALLTTAVLKYEQESKLAFLRKTLESWKCNFELCSQLKYSSRHHTTETALARVGLYRRMYCIVIRMRPFNRIGIVIAQTIIFHVEQGNQCLRTQMKKRERIQTTGLNSQSHARDENRFTLNNCLGAHVAVSKANV